MYPRQESRLRLRPPLRPRLPTHPRSLSSAHSLRQRSLRTLPLPRHHRLSRNQIRNQKPSPTHRGQLDRRDQLPPAKSSFDIRSVCPQIVCGVMRTPLPPNLEKTHHPTRAASRRSDMLSQIDIEALIGQLQEHALADAPGTMTAEQVDAAISLLDRCYPICTTSNCVQRTAKRSC